MLKELDHYKLPVIQELDPNMLDRPLTKVINTLFHNYSVQPVLEI